MLASYFAGLVRHLSKTEFDEKLKRSPPPKINHESTSLALPSFFFHWRMEWSLFFVEMCKVEAHVILTSERACKLRFGKS